MSSSSEYTTEREFCTILDQVFELYKPNISLTAPVIPDPLLNYANKSQLSQAITKDALFFTLEDERDGAGTPPYLDPDAFQLKGESSKSLLQSLNKLRETLAHAEPSDLPWTPFLD